jgi:hypothetical protein
LAVRTGLYAPRGRVIYGPVGCLGSRNGLGVSWQR